MKIYVAGKITGLENYKELFEEAARELRAEGHVVLLPTILPEGFEQNDYMYICYAMIDVCDGVYFLENWRDSRGARSEYAHAVSAKKLIRVQSK